MFKDRPAPVCLTCTFRWFKVTISEGDHMIRTDIPTYCMLH